MNKHNWRKIRTLRRSKSLGFELTRTPEGPESYKETMEHRLVGNVHGLLMCTQEFMWLEHVGRMVPLESEIHDFRILESTSQLSRFASKAISQLPFSLCCICLRKLQWLTQVSSYRWVKFTQILTLRKSKIAMENDGNMDHLLQVFFIGKREFHGISITVSPLVYYFFFADTLYCWIVEGQPSLSMQVVGGLKAAPHQDVFSSLYPPHASGGFTGQIFSLATSDQQVVLRGQGRENILTQLSIFRVVVVWELDRFSVLRWSCLRSEQSRLNFIHFDCKLSTTTTCISWLWFLFSWYSTDFCNRKRSGFGQEWCRLHLALTWWWERRHW